MGKLHIFSLFLERNGTHRNQNIRPVETITSMSKEIVIPKTKPSPNGVRIAFPLNGAANPIINATIKNAPPRNNPVGANGSLGFRWTYQSTAPRIKPAMVPRLFVRLNLLGPLNFFGLPNPNHLASNRIFTGFETTDNFTEPRELILKRTRPWARVSIHGWAAL